VVKRLNCLRLRAQLQVRVKALSAPFQRQIGSGFADLRF